MSIRAFEVVYLQPTEICFERKGDTLSLTLNGDHGSEDGVHYPRVTLRSCFPVSEEAKFISVRSASKDLPSGDGTEIGIIKNLEDLKPSDRDAVIAELNLHYFVPKIQQVHEIKEELGFLYWTVDTDKGRQEFVMRNSVIRYAREVSPGHWLIIDVNQSRYEIPDIAALDESSQKLLQRYLYL
jgi:hypothetical protein